MLSSIEQELKVKNLKTHKNRQPEKTRLQKLKIWGS